MHRLIVALLSALDALIQVAGGLTVIAAPLTALWVFGFGPAADWSGFWPTTAAVWQAGNLVPLQITLPDAVIAAGISQDAASFAFSLAPLGFAAFTVIFGVRSGARAARSGAWVSGVGSAAVVVTALSALISVTATSDVVTTVPWQAIGMPAALYAVAVLVGGVVSAWRNGDDGIVDAVRDRLERRGGAETVSAVALGASVTTVALIGVGALALAVAVVVSVGESVALYQAANVDVLGAVVVTLGQLAYIPTLIVWAIAWVAGPGFAFGAGSTVSPVGADLAVVPSIPALGAIPEASTTWLLLVALFPVAAGALGGWFARSRLHAEAGGDAVPPRLAATFGIAASVGLAAGGLAAAASGAIGPGRLSEVGPQPGPLALAVSLEVLVGAAILLLSPLGASVAGGTSAAGYSAHAPRPRHGIDPTALPGDEPTALPGDEPTALPGDEPTALPGDDRSTAPATPWTRDGAGQ